MLTEKQIEELKEHLNKAQNPIFFFDNDPDGLCSFLLLRRYLGRGNGVAIKSFPEMNFEHFKRVQEFNADYIFILDKPMISKAFFEEVKKFNIPVVWIDHHKIENNYIPSFVNYYNPCFNKIESSEPVTYLCFSLTNKKEDEWIALIGCISDKFTPPFYPEFKKNYPELAIDSDDAFDIFYKSSIGTIAKMFSFGLKDRITNVNKMLKFLINAKSPHDALEETPKNQEMHERFKQISKKSQKFIEKAKNQAGKEKILFFQYAGDLSISADLANELIYIFPKKIIVVIYVTGIKANISVRGEGIKDAVLKSLKDLDGATGGGHENAVGCQMKIKDLEVFKENLTKLAL